MYLLGGIRSTGLFGWCICVYFVGVMVCVFEDHVLLGGVELVWGGFRGLLEGRGWACVCVCLKRGMVCLR